jgi:hypothetical protein
VSVRLRPGALIDHHAAWAGLIGDHAASLPSLPILLTIMLGALRSLPIVLTIMLRALPSLTIIVGALHTH